MTFRFVHAADLHLDTPFESIGAAAPAVRDALRDASLDAFDALIALTLEREADALLIAGDVYDGAIRGVRAQLRFRRGLDRLSERGVAAFIVHGNHDPLEGWSAITSWPAGVHVFGAEPQSIPLVKGGRELATVHGISYARRDTRENLAQRLNRSPGGGLQIGLLHATVGSHPEHAPFSPTTAEELRRIGLDYWALGHVHQREIVAREPWIVYPGNLQGRSPKPSERGAKGALVVEVDAGGVREPEFVALDAARFLAFELDVAAFAELSALREGLAEQARSLRETNRGRGLILRATVTGRGELHAHLLRPGAVEELLRDLRDGEPGTEPFLWWETVRVRTAALLDREALRRRGDFAASVVELSDRYSLDPTAYEAFLDERLGLLQSGRYARALDDLELSPPEDLLRGAEAVALEMLTGQEDG